jgi:hypothetical protein
LPVHSEVIEKDLGWEQIKKDLLKLNGAVTEVGLFGHGGSPETDVAARGAVHELGSPRRNIPQRPFTRNAFDANQRKFYDFIDSQYGTMLDGRLSPARLIALTGEKMVYYIKRSISFGTFLPLKPRTILMKGSSKPLIDTAIMRNSVTHKDEV